MRCLRLVSFGGLVLLVLGALVAGLVLVRSAVISLGAWAIGYLLAIVFAYVLLTLAYVAGIEYPTERRRARRRRAVAVEQFRLTTPDGSTGGVRQRPPELADAARTVTGALVTEVG